MFFKKGGHQNHRRNEIRNNAREVARLLQQLRRRKGTGGPSKDDTYGLQPRFVVLNPAAEATLPQPSVPLIDRMANSEAMLLSLEELAVFCCI
ncbi:hypothetical protein JTE90_021139 [Oedothorax gibbosus]|uniref:Uncharacterized protein n=1 Tax=Oedothorax gibbosus TaxID=931172 RepID=A0AAV6U2P8_9ARAC|nr:hypothetical protein JTE90_021139 [Oedothorax gibbosus]